MVVGLVVWRQIRKGLVTCKGWCESGILDYSTVFALDRVIPGKRRALGRSIKANFVRPQSFLFLVTGRIFLDHRQIHVPLGPIGQVLERGARFCTTVRVRAAAGDTSVLRSAFLDLGHEESIGGGRKTVVPLHRSCIGFVLRGWESLSDLAHASRHLDSFQ